MRYSLFLLALTCCVQPTDIEWSVHELDCTQEREDGFVPVVEVADPTDIYGAVMRYDDGRRMTTAPTSASVDLDTNVVMVTAWNNCSDEVHTQVIIGTRKAQP